MRINGVKKYLVDAFNALEFEQSLVRHSNVDIYTIDNWERVCSTMQQLQSHPAFQYDITEIFKLGVHTQAPTKVLRIEASQHKIFVKHYNALNDSLSAIIKFMEEFFDDDIADQLNIKIPNDLSLTEVEKIFSDLDFIFNKCHVISTMNERDTVSLKRVYSGSIWFAVFVSSAVISLIGGIVRIALWASREYIKNQEALQRLRMSKSLANVMEAAEHELIEGTRQLMAVEINKLIEDREIKFKDGEEKNSFILAVDKVTDIYYKGAEIFASSEAPKEISDMFPKQEETLKLPNELLKLDAPKSK